ncbi:zeta toxin family protein [Micromonospora sp. LAH09]|uniref:zeta toxin family protein n=1 Tax=Micromonospora cabrerizensis TaxID=2911213 RepID=UPI001EE99958|nr:zeta toxin family protein [Micromonospora cabrerizensis]MCG5469493.1 zeta toxin family protein [Micromonospora cabrerizensis]
MGKSTPNAITNRRIQSDFNLGGGAAEADGLLQEAFFETGHYRAIVSRRERKCFLVGRTGSGKSAALQKVEEEHRSHVIRINPEDLSLPYITDLGVVRYLSSLDVHMDPLFIALWKHVLLIEIIKHRYNVDSPGAMQRFMSILMDRIKKDRSKQAALEYLEEFEGRFWCETDERVREITKRFESQIEAEAGGKLPGTVGIKSSGSSTKTVEERAEMAQRFQRIVNETQLPRLNKMMTVLDDDILDSPQHYTYIVIDDLDRDWADEKVKNDLIRCLFRTVAELVRVDNLKILVALRTNILESLDFGQTGGQEEKFRALSLRVRWTRGDLHELLDGRTHVAAERHGLTHIQSLADLLPAPTKNRPDPLGVILARTLMRPRDAIAFLNQCLENSSGEERITWEAIHSAEQSYSADRLLALRDEWKPTYAGIDRVLQNFTGAPRIMNSDELIIHLDNCILLSTDPDFSGNRWMAEVGNAALYGYGDWAEMYHPLVKLLYNIGFLGCSLGKKNPMIYSHDDIDFMNKAATLREIASFAVHPAFQPALDVF